MPEKISNIKTSQIITNFSFTTKLTKLKKDGTNPRLIKELWIHIVFHFFLGSGELEFEEFCILAARFLIEEDEEQMRKELKEAFRFYDKEGKTK